MSTSLTFEQLLERDGHLAYTNKGVSMMPLLRQSRDIMIIRRKGEYHCKKLDAVLFKRRNSRGIDYVMHRVLRVNRDGTYWIIGDNCVTGETVAEADVIGILTAVVRDGRTIPVTDPGYRMYVNIWCRFYRLRIVVLRMKHLTGRFLCKLRLRHRPT